MSVIVDIAATVRSVDSVGKSFEATSLVLVMNAMCCKRLQKITYRDISRAPIGLLFWMGKHGALVNSSEQGYMQVIPVYFLSQLKYLHIGVRKFLVSFYFQKWLRYAYRTGWPVLSRVKRKWERDFGALVCRVYV
jgi:hypothetical protein